jgi:hypothetical protein
LRAGYAKVLTAEEKTCADHEFKVSRQNFKVELLAWLTAMKRVWADYPVDPEAVRPDSVKFFGGCQQLENRTLGNTPAELPACFATFGVSAINGSFVGGHLDGMATVAFKNGSLIRAPFRHGCLHGLARRFSCQYGSCDFDYQPWNVPDRLAEVGTSGSMIWIIRSFYAVPKTCM